MSNIIHNSNYTKMRVSEKISAKDIDSWNNEHKGKAITIKAGCGKGKSYFIKNCLYERAKAENKKILILVHRSNCDYQFSEEIIRDGKTDIIDISTYQSIEWDLLNKEVVDLSKYKYLVSDEFHYFISDSGFNIMSP